MPISRDNPRDPTAARLASLCVSPSETLLQVMERINKNGQGIALLVEQDGRLIATITDGPPGEFLTWGTEICRNA